ERLSQFSNAGVNAYKRFTYTTEVVFPLSFLAFLSTLGQYVSQRKKIKIFENFAIWFTLLLVCLRHGRKHSHIYHPFKVSRSNHVSGRFARIYYGSEVCLAVTFVIYADSFIYFFKERACAEKE